MRQTLIIILSVLLIIPVSGLYNPVSKTRWSAIHSIPDADLLSGGKFLIDVHNFLYSDLNDGCKYKPSALLTFGVIEWINLEAGYAGGGIFGLKARILAETNRFLPSMAVGIHNVISHKEAYNFGYSPDSLNNELYLAFAKNIENIRLRLHAGVQSIPQNDNEKVNPFFALEKFFGSGFYLSLEGQRRNKQFYGSIFGSYRFLKRKMEISAGVIDFTGLINKDDDKISLKFTTDGQSSFNRPGIFLGIRFLGEIKAVAKNDGFTSIEDRIAHQNESFKYLQKEVDSLKNLLKNSKNRIDNIDQSLKLLSDSSENEYNQLKKTIMEKLIAIKTLYEEEPFEPENVKKKIQEIISYREKIIPVLQEICLDRKENSQIRVYAVSVIGELGSRNAADAMIEILAQTQLPEMKIETMIGLGKLKEVRAIYLMQKLANDPHEGVAFTASEILQKLEKETGIKMSQNKAEIVPENSIPEKKTGKSYEKTVKTAVENENPESKNESNIRINVVNSPAVTETDIIKEEKAKIDSLPVPALNEE
jgi:hypothetical protein